MIEMEFIETDTDLDAYFARLEADRVADLWLTSAPGCPHRQGLADRGCSFPEEEK